MEFLVLRSSSEIARQVVVSTSTVVTLAAALNQKSGNARVIRIP